MTTAIRTGNKNKELARIQVKDINPRVDAVLDELAQTDLTLESLADVQKGYRTLKAIAVEACERFDTDLGECDLNINIDPAANCNNVVGYVAYRVVITYDIADVTPEVSKRISWLKYPVTLAPPIVECSDADTLALINEQSTVVLTAVQHKLTDGVTTLNDLHTVFEKLPTLVASHGCTFKTPSGHCQQVWEAEPWLRLRQGNDSCVEFDFTVTTTLTETGKVIHGHKYCARVAAPTE